MTTKTTTASKDLDLQAEIARLQAENEALKKAKQGKLSCKVSAKGAVSIYGLGRFPITLYKSQFLRLRDFMSEVEAFVKAHDAELKTKEQA